MPRCGRKCPVFIEVSEASTAPKWPEMFRQSSVIPCGRSAKHAPCARWPRGVCWSSLPSIACARRVRAACKLVPMFRSSFPRRQQARRLRRAGAIAAGAGATVLAGLLALVMGGLVLDARRWVRLAARSGVGARSEAQVRRVLGGLEAEGWRLRHSLVWGGRGDIDSLAIASNGIAYAIETKSRTFDARHLARARDTAVWLRRRRRRWCRVGVFPVLCVARARGLEAVEAGVLVVSLDRLVPALRASAGTSPRPRFLAT